MQRVSPASIILGLLGCLSLSSAVEEGEFTQISYRLEPQHWLWMARLEHADPTYQPQVPAIGMRLVEKKSALEAYRALGVVMEPGESFIYSVATSQMIARLSPANHKKLRRIHETMKAWKQGRTTVWLLDWHSRSSRCDLDLAKRHPFYVSWLGHDRGDRAEQDVFAANAVSGGNRDPNSRVSPGDDTPIPSGNYSVETKIRAGTIGFLVLNVPGCLAIEIHLNGVTTGCIAMQDSWNLMVQNMADTKRGGTEAIPLSVWFEMSDGTANPHGNTGNGNGDLGNPPGYWPELPLSPDARP